MGPREDRGAGDAGRGAGSGVGAAAARDYIYRRLRELGRIILSERGTRREEAKRERAFLEAELAKVLREGRRIVRLDPELERAVRGKVTDRSRTVFPNALDKSQPGPRHGTPVKRSPYWDSCEKMGFRELREFIDDSLRGTQVPNGRDRPRSKNQFLDLLELLSGKVGDDIDRAPAGSASLALEGGKLKKLRRHRSNLIKALARAQSKLSSSTGGTKEKIADKVRMLRAELGLVEAKIDRLQAQEKGRPATPHNEAQRLRKIQYRRAKIVGRVGRDIERIFADGGPGQSSHAGAGSMTAGARLLPWRVLPPGKLSLERVLAHYERLGRARPDVRYEPERIRKAYSLGPDGCYVGADEFDGYVVFTFPYTKKALLERPVYGNAIYVLGPDWKRLSRMSKRELLADDTHRVTKIVHRGDWFSRVVNALDLR